MLTIRLFLSTRLKRHWWPRLNNDSVWNLLSSTWGILALCSAIKTSVGSFWVWICIYPHGCMQGKLWVFWGFFCLCLHQLYPQRDLTFFFASSSLGKTLNVSKKGGEKSIWTQTFNSWRRFSFRFWSGLWLGHPKVWIFFELNHSSSVCMFIFPVSIKELHPAVGCYHLHISLGMLCSGWCVGSFAQLFI